MGKQLLAVIEQGGYPNFIPEYKALGFNADIVNSVRKASKAIKKQKPDVIVAEFNLSQEFRDRVSNIESLLAKVESDSPKSKVILFYEKGHMAALEAVQKRFTIDVILPFPINQEKLMSVLATLVD